MNDLWGAVIGQQRAVGLLSAAAARPVHAYLLVGPPGSGKRQAARAFAAELLGGADRDVALVGRGEHPDVREIHRVGAAISVEQADEVIHLASMSPVEGARKVLILDEFHLLRPEAAAKLLKTIEEPPPSTVFCVLADDIGPDLVTIASRCVRVEFGPLAESVVIEALVAEGVEFEHAHLAAAAAHGDLDRARLLAADPGAAARRALFTALPHRIDGTGATAARLADEIVTTVDSAAAALTARHDAEIAAAAERATRLGDKRGSKGAAKSMEERHKREIRRHRTDELRSGLLAMAHVYRDELAAGTARDGAGALAAVAAITQLATDLDRNPNEALQLQALLVRLSPA